MAEEDVELVIVKFWLPQLMPVAIGILQK